MQVFLEIIIMMISVILSIYIKTLNMCYCKLYEKNMDKLTSTSTTTTNNNNITVDELIDVLLDAIMRLKDLLRKPDVACICNFVPRYI